LRARRALRGLRGDASEAGHATQVGQHVGVVVADGDRHVAAPRTSAVVQANLEAALGVQEPGQGMRVGVSEPLGGAYPLVYERIRPLCPWMHRVERSGRIFKAP
jgi:hypothetical protein